jgi:vancomycin resistance protein YoaR
MDRIPTFSDRIIFQIKATVFRLHRLCLDCCGLSNCVRGRLDSVFPEANLLAESRSVLWNPGVSKSEWLLQAGKVQNLRIAGRRLNGCAIPAGKTFSFWQQIGFPGRLRGFVRGRELRQGCMIPTIGGGLCQLSNALYDAALKANFEVQERHRHSQIVPDSLAEQNRDATVFWNYVDLRFSSSRPFHIRVELTPRELIVQLREGK